MINKSLGRLCNHEADPATIEYDKKHGRKAICKYCGAKLYLTRFIDTGRRKDEKPSQTH